MCADSLGRCDSRMSEGTRYVNDRASAHLLREHQPVIQSELPPSQRGLVIGPPGRKLESGPSEALRVNGIKSHAPAPTSPIGKRRGKHTRRRPTWSPRRVELCARRELEHVRRLAAALIVRRSVHDSRILRRCDPVDVCGVTGRGVLARASSLERRRSSLRLSQPIREVLRSTAREGRPGTAELNTKIDAGPSSGYMPKQARQHLHGRALRPAARPSSAPGQTGAGMSRGVCGKP